jgi:hypothetical protein
VAAEVAKVIFKVAPMLIGEFDVRLVIVGLLPLITLTILLTLLLQSLVVFLHTALYSPGILTDILGVNCPLDHKIENPTGQAEAEIVIGLPLHKEVEPTTESVGADDVVGIIVMLTGSLGWL